MHPSFPLNPPIPREKKVTDMGEISNACLSTLGYHAHQVLNLGILCFARYNVGHKCPARHSRVQKWIMHYNA